MVSAARAYGAANAQFHATVTARRDTSSVEQKTSGLRQDRVSFGAKPLSAADSQRVVLDRAFEKLRGVVSEARAALGLPEDAVIDTSPEATGNRIADFALGFFSKYAENHGLADDEAGRKAYADFIGGAIAQGISEARGILDSLNALNGDVSGNIDKTAEHIQSRLDDFIRNGFKAG